MKYSLILFVIAISAGVITADEKYTTQYDNIDWDDILNNQRLYKQYFSCLTNKGKCTPDGKELKETLPDAIATNCAKCSEKQKKVAEKVLGFMLDNKSKDFAEVEKMYDPEGNYRRKIKEHSLKFESSSS